MSNVGYTSGNGGRECQVRLGLSLIPPRFKARAKIGCASLLACPKLARMHRIVRFFIVINFPIFQPSPSPLVLTSLPVLCVLSASALPRLTLSNLP